MLYAYKNTHTVLGRLLTNCNLFPNYMTKHVVSKVVHYIIHFHTFAYLKNSLCTTLNVKATFCVCVIAAG